MGKIRDYTQVALAKLTDLFVIDRNESGVHTTNSVSVEQIGDTIAGTQTHSTLTTSDKTLIGAINEASSSGGVDELDELTDVTITSATLGDNLRSDGNGGWINAKQVVEMTNAQWSAISDKATWRSNHKNTLLVLTDATNLNATANDLSMGSAPYASGTVGKAITSASADSSITFTPADTSKVTLTSLTAYRNGAVLILNLYLNAVISIPANSEWRIGDFSGTNAGLGAISGVVVNRADSGLLGSYCFTTGNQRLYTTMNTNVASGTNLYLTIVTFTA